MLELPAYEASSSAPATYSEPSRPVLSPQDGVLPKQASVRDTLALTKLVHLRGAEQLAARPCNRQCCEETLAATYPAEHRRFSSPRAPPVRFLEKKA